MRYSAVPLVALCALVLCAIALPDVAAACTGKCQVVSPPACRRCVDAGFETGVLCQDSGPCGCFYIQCAAAKPEPGMPATQPMLAELGLGAPTVAPSSCLSAAAEVAAPLAAAAD